MDLQYSANKIWIENEEGKTVGEVDFFQDEQGNYDIVHTEVDDSLRGQGAAGRLVQAAADYIRSTGHQTKASCSYASRWFMRHKVYSDIYLP